MVEHHNFNKITADKYSSRNGPVRTQTLNIRVLSLAQLKEQKPLKYRRNQSLKHRHQHLQEDRLNRLFPRFQLLLIRLTREVQHLLKRLLNRHTQISRNRVLQSPLQLKVNQQLKVYRPHSKLRNRDQLPRLLPLSSNSPRSQ